MPSALVPLATTTLASSSATVTFSSISGAYRDLRIVFQGTMTADTNIGIRINSDTAGNYNWVYMYGDGTNTSSSTQSNVTDGYVGRQLSGTIGQTTVDIMDYTATDKHKTYLSRSNNTNSMTAAVAGRWANTAAVTTVQLMNPTGTTFAAGCVVSLYGVLS